MVCGGTRVFICALCGGGRRAWCVSWEMAGRQAGRHGTAQGGQGGQQTGKQAGKQTRGRKADAGLHVPAGDQHAERGWVCGACCADMYPHIADAAMAVPPCWSQAGAGFAFLRGLQILLATVPFGEQGCIGALELAGPDPTHP